MSMRSKVTKWRNVGRFCVERATDYGELLGVELEETRTRLVRELSALVALAVAGLFTLSFVCIAIIATAWRTPYFLQVVWGVAATWLVVSVISLLFVRAQKPGRSLHLLQREIRSDLDTLKEALK
ncbi:putative superfamily III holin-X [Paraburkholderia sp. BL6669N2]|uniref:phage holin family protein n=1 Tax=unclassified Paraburkholderia TaxID=2615204 RepID=UPI000D081FC4|nr:MULTISPECIES: phage holin family protein [unclassified Paraburkholderia]PRY04056.1 putative superfamily III holin-X [Paraburkholderia sp. BL25I1N1]REG50635.1 putative superfamily III holin-X [Paraburkholderia sp. BL6669N2]TDY23054.1 putative superfamily III holin-X [Paraburkholderia sp. BL6665CI2N2]